MNNPRVGVAVFVWKDNKFLMGRRRGSHGHDTWSIPGGHLEYGESIDECASREVFEETNMRIKNIRLLTITNDIFKEEKKHYLTIWLEADWQKNTPKIKEPEKCVAQKWHTFRDLPAPLFEPCFKNLKIKMPDLFL